MLLKINFVKEEIAAVSRKVYLTEDETAKTKKNCDLLEKGKNRTKSETIHLDAFSIKNIGDRFSNSFENCSKCGSDSGLRAFLADCYLSLQTSLYFQYFICFCFRN